MIAKVWVWSGFKRLNNGNQVGHPPIVEVIRQPDCKTAMVRLEVVMRLRTSQFGIIWMALAVMACVCPSARATEHVTLKNGFELDCVRREAVGDKVRLYLANSGAASADDSNYLEVAAGLIVRIDVVHVDTVAEVPAPSAMVKTSISTLAVTPTKEELHQMLAQAGAAHNIDEDLLASVVRA